MPSIVSCSFPFRHCVNQCEVTRTNVHELKEHNHAFDTRSTFCIKSILAVIFVLK